MPLSDRYINDDIPEWELNPVHAKYRQLFLDKLSKGIYKTETVTKCLCGGKEFERISSKDRFGLPFGNVICKSCGLLLCSPRLRESDLPEFYDKEYHGLVFGSERITDFEHMVDKQQGLMIYAFLKKHISQKKSFEIAEIGAGVGNNLKAIIEEAKKNSVDVTGYGCEYSEACVNFGKEKYGLNMVQGSTDALLKLNKKFDLVIMSHVLEHFTDPVKELKSIKKMLKDDGMIYVEVPGILDLHNKPVYQCDFLRYSVLAHMYNFSLGTLTNITGMAGFELIEGTEFVRSIYKIDTDREYVTLNYYNKIIDYLHSQEQNRRIFYQLSLTQANVIRQVNQISTEISGEVVRNREYIQRNFDFLSGNRLLINKSAEDLLKLLNSIQKEFSDILIERTKREDELVIKYDNLIKIAQKSEDEFTKQLSEFRIEKQKCDNEYKKQIEELKLNNKAAQDSFNARMEQLRSDNQAVEAWLKEQIVQILTEKKNIENLLKKQIDSLSKEKSITDQRLQSVQSKYDNLNYWHNVMVNSLSWKITAPIRKVKEILFPKWKG